MSNYSFLVASDMDYTLLMPGREISPANLKAAKALQDKGGALTLATGRTSYLTGSYARALDIKIPLITSNGAALFDPLAFKDIYSLDFSESTLKTLLTLFLENNANATGYSSEGIFFLPESSRREFIADYNNTVTDDIKALTGEITKEVFESKSYPSFNKFLLVAPSEELLGEVKKLPGIQIVTSAKDFYDVMPVGPSKGDALLKLADYLDIPRENVFALGDSENDISMLEAAGHGIAMKGSDPEVLKVAEYVSDTCEEDGFAKAIYDFILPLFP